MKRDTINNKGSALIGALFITVLMGLAAMGIVSGERGSASNELTNVQAQNLVGAGMEYALGKINRGEDPDVSNKPFGPGTFTVTKDLESSTVTVTAEVGKSRRSNMINADFTQSCVSLDTSEANASGSHLRGIKLVKNCNEAAIVTSMSLDWNFGTCHTETTEVPCTQENMVIDYSPYADPDHEGKILICHVPPGNPSNAHTLSISVAGWENGHDGGTGESHNLDFLGRCSNPPQEEYARVCPSPTEEVVCDFEGEAAHGGATVNRVGLNSTTIYDTASNIGSPTVSGADAQETIDVEDAVLTDNGDYAFQGPGETPSEYITFSQDLPSRGYYTVTVNFADGSTLSDSFYADAEAASSEESEDMGFEVDDGEVIVDPNWTLDLEILGSSITYGPQNAEMDVTVDLGTADASGNITWNSLFSNTDVDGGEAYSTASGEAGTTYVVRATATYKKKFSATYDSRNTLQVKSLMNGDHAPALEGFGGTQPVGASLDPYVSNDGTVTIQSNQVLMLFELGVDVASASDPLSADYQDLVLLFTFESDEDAVHFKQVGGTLNNNLVK